LPSGALYALDRVYCLQSSADIQRHAGAGEAAVASINSALEMLKLAPYYARTRQLSLLLDLAESYRVAGKLRESVGTSEEAARLMESMGRGETQRAGTLFNNWGLTLNLMGRQLEAEKIFRRAIEIGSSDANQGNVSAMLLLNYGRVLGDLGRHREADGFTRRAYADSKRSGMDVVVAQSRIVQASVSRELGDISEAERAIDEFDSLCRRVFPPGHAAFASLASQRSLNAQARGDRVKAVKLANEAVALNEALIRERGEARDFLPMLLQRRSEIRYNAADIEGALADARRAAEMFEKLAQPGSHSSQLGRTYLALGRALDRKQSGVEACLYLHKAGDHLRHSLGSEHPLTFEAVRLSCR
jgi:tetratricopeptide (TPR) repeat protein